jgi:fructose-1,6-bisphosphatase/inositol monophosphatase family enzyme/predicted metal-dependent phosphoesterase TrpH
MKADLHVHTDISDSSCDLEHTLKLAKVKGITHLGIVNHDTVEGLKEAIEKGAMEGIKVIPGVEISAYDSESGKKVHILGYSFDLEAEKIRKLCDSVLLSRSENSIRQLKTLINNNYEININKIFNRSKNSRVIYKQHIMAELKEQGYTDTIYSELYKKLFKNNGICAETVEYVDAVEAIKAIKADKGIAILAHPGQLDSYSLIDKLFKAGLDGIELYHEDHTEEDCIKIKEYGDKYNFILTGGSDFHGEYGTDIELGEIVSPLEYLYIFDDSIKKDIELTANAATEDNLEHMEFITEDCFEFIKALVKKAGNDLKEVMREEICVRLKNNDYRDIVTKFDVEIESFLIEKIAKKYPKHSFITEEKTCENQCFTEYTWIIDPIDGTTNFVNIGKDFAISIALYKNKKPLIGVVYDVMKDEMYSAVIGKGAFLNGTAIGEVNQNRKLTDALIDISLNSINLFYEAKDINISKLIKDIRGHRAFGVASLSICKIALGELQGYISAKLSLWDYAAAIIILKEVGGVYSCAHTGEEEFSLNPGVFIAAENTAIMKGISRRIEK